MSVDTIYERYLFMNVPSFSFSSLLSLLAFLFSAPDFLRFVLLMKDSILTVACLDVHEMKKLFCMHFVEHTHYSKAKCAQKILKSLYINTYF